MFLPNLGTVIHACISPYNSSHNSPCLADFVRRRRSSEQGPSSTHHVCMVGLAAAAPDPLSCSWPWDRPQRWDGGRFLGVLLIIDASRCFAQQCQGSVISQKKQKRFGKLRVRLLFWLKGALPSPVRQGHLARGCARRPLSSAVTPCF